MSSSIKQIEKLDGTREHGVKFEIKVGIEVARLDRNAAPCIQAIIDYLGAHKLISAKWLHNTVLDDEGKRTVLFGTRNGWLEVIVTPSFDRWDTGFVPYLPEFFTFDITEYKHGSGLVTTNVTIMREKAFKRKASDAETTREYNVKIPGDWTSPLAPRPAATRCRLVAEGLFQRGLIVA